MSISLGVATFNKVIRVMITKMYDDYVFLPKTEEEWIRECKGFIENYEFPCVGAWGWLPCPRLYTVEKLL